MGGGDEEEEEEKKERFMRGENSLPWWKMKPFGVSVCVCLKLVV